MDTTEEQKMGRFSVELDLANHEDLFRLKAGLISQSRGTVFFHSRSWRAM